MRGRGSPFKGSGGMSGVRLICSRRGRFLRGVDVMGLESVSGNTVMLLQGGGISEMRDMLVRSGGRF